MSLYYASPNSHYEKFSDGTVKCIDEEIPFEIPESWEWCRVSSLFILNPKNQADDNTLSGFIPMEKIDATYLSSFSFAERKWKDIKSGFTHFSDGDVAFAKITPCFQNRKSMILKGLPNGIGAGTTELKVLRPYADTIAAEYILFFLESPYFVEEATFKGTANQQRILSGYLEGKLFPIPPKSEQIRIVEIVTKSISIAERYDKAQFSLDKLNLDLPNNLKKSILQEAIQGKLVPQIAEEGDASELLKQIEQEKQKLVKEGKLKKKDLVSSTIYRGDDNRYYEKVDDKIIDITESIPFEIPIQWRWVRFGNIVFNRDNERIPLSVSQRQHLNKLYDYYGASGVIDKVDKYLFDKDLLLIGEDGANLINRSTPIAFIARGKYWVNNHAHVIDCINQENMAYMCLYLNSISLVDFVTGTAQPKMNQEKMNSILVALPPLQEQKRITQKLSELLSKIGG